MDVTSLLNSSSAALQRRDSVDSSTPSATGGTTAASTAVPTPSPERTPSRRTSGSRSPNRNRTPWDAGGYSLPLSLDTKSMHTPSTARPVFYCESPTDGQPTSSSPKSPKHKFSDSRSSLSSYASSNNSISHSRISSLSTVSEFQPLTNLITEITLNGRMSAEKLDTGASSRLSQSGVGAAFGAVGSPRSPPSPIHSTSPADKNDTSPLPIRTRQHNYSGSYIESISPTDPGPSHRPGSPSDAVIIRRGQGGLPLTGIQSHSHTDLSHGTSSLSPDNLLSRAHKRAVSAPNFPALTIDRFATSVHMGRSKRAARAAPSGDQSPDDPDSHDDNEIANAVVTSGDDSLDIVSEEIGNGHNDEEDTKQLEEFMHRDMTDISSLVPGCMYIDNCNTASTLRKAISHIFGRNKLCTRIIPPNIWVHICRKHYQRARYRNTTNWALTQCHLIESQVRRIEAWSNQNRRDGGADFVRDWSFTRRKREQERINSAKRKRYDMDENDGGGADDEEENARAQGRALPDWLVAKLATGYTSDQIIDIVREIKVEIDEGNLFSLPDIEFLPNLIKHDKSKGNPNTKRKIAHARSQSMASGLRNQENDSYPTTRRVSQPNTNAYWSRDDGRVAAPAEKRQRVVDSASNDYLGLPITRRALPGVSSRNTDVPPRSANRVVPRLDSRSSTVARLDDGRAVFSGYQHTAENTKMQQDRYRTAGLDSFGTGSSRSSGPSGLAGSSGPLPAPVAHMGGMASDRSSNYNPPAFRQSHQRSYSEVGFSHQNTGYSTHADSYQQNNSLGPAGYVSRDTTRDNGYAPLSVRHGDNNGGFNPNYNSNFSFPQYQSAYTHQAAYTADTSNYRQQTQGMSGGSYPGGAAKHMRHQSTPVVPRHTQGMTSSATDLSAFSISQPGSYSSYVRGTAATYQPLSTSAQTGYLSNTNSIASYTPAVTNALSSMPRVEELPDNSDASSSPNGDTATGPYGANGSLTSNGHI
ncbi:hypothetical protein B0H66DRAFT_157454 [Apodospora peruviana]|uniref:ORP1 like protein n=1 Tax=Apodospora peruviana TaxID=516989 RepID=A0AAE0IK43_9PEZI|nr:hypothetical protein B0H66DRAFT_157454 [Apodospora peruviana]